MTAGPREQPEFTIFKMLQSRPYSARELSDRLKTQKKTINRKLYKGQRCGHWYSYFARGGVVPLWTRKTLLCDDSTMDELLKMTGKRVDEVEAALIHDIETNPGPKGGRGAGRGKGKGPAGRGRGGRKPQNPGKLAKLQESNAQLQAEIDFLREGRRSAAEQEEVLQCDLNIAREAMRDLPEFGRYTAAAYEDSPSYDVEVAEHYAALLDTNSGRWVKPPRS